jgi:rubrerythrin
MEIESRSFYEAAAQQTSDAAIRQLLGDLAQEELQHEITASEITEGQTESGAIQMDGSVSTLAPLFAAAFATSSTMATFKVGLAASVGARAYHSFFDQQFPQCAGGSMHSGSSGRNTGISSWLARGG